jgi:pimeloyl-ACP methyl ester carboxylesterase
MILYGTEMGGGRPVLLLHGLFGMARNLGVLQRGLAQRFRVLALDLRNHGASPHAPDMRYATMAADVAETLADRDAVPAAVVGHSMGGKTAMMLALTRPEAVGRLVVADIAPVGYPPRNTPFVTALRSVPLTPGLTRAEADSALAATIAEPPLRAFLLQNLAFGPQPAWRIDLDAIATALPDLEGWDAPKGARFDGPALFMAGERSDFIRPEHRDTIRALFPAARFVAVKNAGHWLHADNPAGVLSVLEAFLHPWAASGSG